MNKQFKKLSEQTISVPKILSYQTLVYKNGSSTFKKKKYHEYAKLIDSQMTKFYSDKPLRVKVNFIFKVPKTYSKKRKFETYGQPYTGYPDRDNSVKIINDVLEDYGYIKNDKNISSLEINAFYRVDDKQEDEIDLFVYEFKEE